MMIMIVVVMLLMKRPVSVDEKIFHAVAEVLCSVLRDVEDPTGLTKIINIIGDFVIAIMIGELFDVLHGNVYTFDDDF